MGQTDHIQRPRLCQARHHGRSHHGIAHPLWGNDQSGLSGRG
jgi:hypothetical protein